MVVSIEKFKEKAKKKMETLGLSKTDIKYVLGADRGAAVRARVRKGKAGRPVEINTRRSNQVRISIPQ